MMSRSHSLTLIISLVFSVVAVLTLSTSDALAHVKWFINTQTAKIDNFQAYSLFDTPVLIWISVALVAIATSIFLDPRLPSVPIMSSKTRHDFIEILRVFTGMSFLLTAYEGAIVAPHMIAYGILGPILVVLQLVIGIMLIANRLLQYAAMLILALMLGVLIQFGFASLFEYSNVIGIALFLLFNNLNTEELRERFKPYSVASLRIFTGLALVTLGITEKVAGAVYGQVFIAEYHWNFMQILGFEVFTDRLFVLSAGVSEIILGTILILGTTTRLTVLTISGFMITSNIVFILQGNNPAALKELIGHLPIIGTALVLLLLGYGERLKVTNLITFIASRNSQNSQST